MSLIVITERVKTSYDGIWLEIFSSLTLQNILDSLG